MALLQLRTVRCSYQVANEVLAAPSLRHEILLLLIQHYIQALLPVSLLYGGFSIDGTYS